MKNTTLLLGLILAAAPAFAQQPAAPVAPAAPAAQVDARFAGWLGCWRLDDDLTGTGARMCITSEKDGVRLQTIVGTNKGIDELVIPDGQTRPIADSECKGTERAEWSNDDARVFRITDVTCGKEAPRVVKTVAFMAPGPAWINVQHVSGAAANTSVRVQRYRRAANQKLADGSTAQQPDANAASRTAAAQTKWSIEDVIEASAKLPAEAVQAALTELHHGFELNRKTLVALDEGGVSESVIDLMVALTYPQKFVVERAAAAPRRSASPPAQAGSIRSCPGMGGASHDCYTPYGYGYRSYYSMCGSGYLFAVSLQRYYGYNYYGNYYPGYGGGWIDIGGGSAHRRHRLRRHSPKAASSTVAATRRSTIASPSHRRASTAAATAAAGTAAVAACRPAATRAGRRAPDRPAAGQFEWRWRFGRPRRGPKGRRPVVELRRLRRSVFTRRRGNLPRPEGITALRPLIFSRRFP